MRKQNNGSKWKKKLLASVLAVSMMTCLAVGIASCRDDSSSSSSSSEESIEKPSFELNVFRHRMLVNTSYQLFVEADEGVDVSNCVWTSSNPNVVSVDSNGLVLAIGEGEATVTVTAGEYSSSCTFTVLATNIAPYLKVNATNNYLRLGEGAKYALSATMEYNAQSYDDFTCTYTSSNSDVVTVSADGEITAVACGKATITLNAAWRNGITVSETVVVDVVSGAYISVDKTDIDLFTANPAGYDFATSSNIEAVLLHRGEEKQATFEVVELLEDGATANQVAVYENGAFKAVGVGSTKFVFACEYEGEELTSFEIAVTVSVPKISLEYDFYQLKASEVSVDLAQTGLEVTAVDKAFIDGTETAVNGTTMALTNAETGRYEISFYINNIEAEYTVDLIVADYFVESVDDLLAMKNDLDAYYVLTQDIDAQGASVGHLFNASWYGGSGGTIGAWAMKDSGFKGTLDGNGHTVSNIAVDGYGLLGTVSPEGVIKNLGIRNVMCTTTDGINFPLATEFYGTMENVSFHLASETPYGPIGILQLNSTLKNVVFFVPNAGVGAICLMGDAVYGSITFENVFVFSNKGVGGIQGNAPTATVFNASDYIFDERFIETDFSKLFDMREGGEWFVEEETQLPLIRWTPNEYLPLVKGEMKPFKNGEDIVLTHEAFDTVRAIFVGETELSREAYKAENGKVTVYASYLSTMTSSTQIVVKTNEYKVECVLQVAKTISSVDDFKAIVNDFYGYYELANNIDFGGEFVQLKDWGDGGAWYNESVSTQNTGFYGTFEGNGHILKNFQTTWGIFGGIGDTAVIRNVGIENAEGVTHATTLSAVIALYNYGTIENISVKTADASSFYAIVARIRGNGAIKNAVIYAKKTTVGVMESSYGTVANVYFVSNVSYQPGPIFFNVADYQQNADFLATDFTAIFDCSANGVWTMDETLKLPFITSDAEMPVLDLVEKSFTVMNANVVSCSNPNILVSMISDGQLAMNATAYDGTPFTIYVTLPETYVRLKSIEISDVWANDGGACISAWIGETYNASALFINGSSGWGGGWMGLRCNIPSEVIAAAGYDKNKNQVAITVQPNAGSQVVFANLTFNYLVEKGEEEEHTCDYSEYAYDEDNHWKKCECGEINEESVVAHTQFTYVKNDDGTYSETCVCGFVKKTVELVEKTYTVMTPDGVSCLDTNVALSTPAGVGAEGQLWINSTNSTTFTDTPVTLTVTLPDMYATLVSVSVENIWTNDPGTGTSVWLGKTYNPSTIFVQGTCGWSNWVGSSFQTTADNIAAAGYANSNQVDVSILSNGGSQVILNLLTFTYLVEKPAGEEPEHVHSFTYTDNGDGTYEKTCACGEVKETVELVEKTYVVTDSGVACSDSSVSLNVTSGQIIMNSAFNGSNHITLTITLPETYAVLQSVYMKDIWSNGTVSTWVGDAYAGASTLFINGANTWGQWYNINATATAEQIATAGYANNKNQVAIGFVSDGGSQVIFHQLTFTYLVEKTNS